MPILNPNLSRRVLSVLLRPAIRFCVRHALILQDITAVARTLLLEEAERELRRTTTKVNASRLSVVTGIYREDIPKIQEETHRVLMPTEDESSNLLVRVISVWQQDPDYLTKAGTPKVLTCEGPGSEFFGLVGSVSKNINPATVLFELQRTESVKVTERGASLLRGGLSFRGDPLQGFQATGQDIGDLLEAATENIYATQALEHHHLRTQYDNVYIEDLPQIHRWILREGKLFHKRIRSFLAQFDHDVHPVSGKTPGARVVLGSFSFIEPPSVERPVDKKATRLPERHAPR